MTSGGPLTTWPRQIDDALARHGEAVRGLGKAIFRLEGEQAELRVGLVADLLEQLELSRQGFEEQAQQLQAALAKPAGGSTR